MTRSPNRPHPYQISDSRFTHHGLYVQETWVQIERNGDKEEVHQMHGPYVTSQMAAAVVADWSAG